MYLHLCSYAGESCTFTVVFASILPDRFWGACYVRKYKLNFRNRELLEERQHFPTGAESTCLERPGRVEPPEENPPAVLLFQTILWTI